jgi:DNA-binding NarL/FixJ family response regulator
MDLVMPLMSGAEAGQIIWAEQPDCKIVFMTGGERNEGLLKERFGSGGYVL